MGLYTVQMKVSWRINYESETPYALRHIAGEIERENRAKKEEFNPCHETAQAGSGLLSLWRDVSSLTY
jgi:hypothetical protein